MTILLTFYDEIRAGDAERVLAELRANPSAAVEVRINSPGGSVTEGLAIYNSLKPRNPIVYVDGIAASIASLIAMAGKRIIAAANSLVMIHDPWTGTEGNSAELRRTADLLDKHRDAMMGAYARTGIAQAKLFAMLAAETWMTAEEALELGFVDEVAAALKYAAHSPASFAGYINTPKELLMHKKARGAAPANPDPQNPSDPLPGTGDDDQRTLDAFRQGLSSDTVVRAARDAVMDAMEKKNQAIAAMATPYFDNAAIRDLAISAMIDPKITPEAFGHQLLAHLGRGVEPLGGAVRIAADGITTLINGVPADNVRVSGGTPTGGDFVAAASDSLAIRAGIRIDKPHPGVRDVRGMGLAEIVRACVTRSGRGSDFGGNSHRALIKAALSTSDFPAILENTLNKALRAGYEVEPATYTAWTRFVTVPDFKPQSRVILGSAPDLLRVLEGAEYTHGSLDEDKSVPYSVGKFGRIIQLTWEALVNDDLDAFARATQAMGQAARRAEADAIYATFAENSGAGPTMQDSATLFHATHGNLASAAAAIDAAALAAARVLLRRQTAVGGGVMNLVPKFLLVAPEHEQAAETLLAAASRGLSQGTDNSLIPAWLAKLELVVEARLSDDAFYVLTGPESVDTFERAWLEADNGPVIEEDTAFATDAKSYKIRHVFGGRWLDWRGVVKVPVSGG